MFFIKISIIWLASFYFITAAASESSSQPDISIDSVLANKSDQCREAILEIDALAKRVILMDGSRVIPKNETTRQQWCRPMQKFTKRIKETLKCVTPFIGQILNVFANGWKKPIKYICKGSFQRSQKHFQCMDDNYLDQSQALESKLMDALHALNSPNVSRDIVLPGICCTTAKMVDGMRNIKYGVCPDSTANPNKFIADRIDEGIKDVLDLVCGPYPTLDVCKEKAPHIIELLKKTETPQRDLKKERFIPSLLLVISSLAIEESES